jgi:hypothetical protein
MAADEAAGASNNYEIIFGQLTSLSRFQRLASWGVPNL